MTKRPRPPGARAGRGERTRLKSARGRTVSSARWLQRQLTDPYVAAAKREGYRSRAAYKLIEIDDRYGLIKPGSTIVDLGAAPGGWSQVAARRSGADQGNGTVIAVDLAEVDAIAGVTMLVADFMEEGAEEAIVALLKGARVNAVLSDMAAPATGHKQSDHLRTIVLAEAAFEFARTVLAPGGSFLAKVLQGGTVGDLLKQLKRDFASVRHVKPKASRADSSELYVLAQGFRATDADPSV